MKTAANLITVCYKWQQFNDTIHEYKVIIRIIPPVDGTGNKSFNPLSGLNSDCLRKGEDIM